MARWASLIVCSVFLSFTFPASHAATIGGTVTIRRKLTKRKVTVEAESYRRGAVVGLAEEFPVDALAFERAHVAVYLEGHLLSESAPPLAAPPTMEQKKRAFVPDFLVVPAGSSVSFPNLDPIFHNVFSLSPPRNFDLGNYPINQTRLVKFPKPGIVMVNCHLHPNMAGTIVVSPNHWATHADGEGHFSLPPVPPGRYTVVAWHKAAGFFRREIRVSEDRDANVDFLIPLDSAGGELDRVAAHAASHTEAHR